MRKWSRSSIRGFGPVLIIMSALGLAACNSGSGSGSAHSVSGPTKEETRQEAKSNEARSAQSRTLPAAWAAKIKMLAAK